jgi:hypothetical protein
MKFENSSRTQEQNFAGYDRHCSVINNSNFLLNPCRGQGMIIMTLATQMIGARLLCQFDKTSFVQAVGRRGCYNV